MNGLVSLHNAAFDWIRRLDTILLPTLARFVFAAVLLVYFWNSGLTKLGGEGVAGLLSPTFNAFAQIFPKGAEAVSYDITQASLFQKFVILAGTWAEFILPVLIVAGLLTRLAALGMIGFVIVQSLTDIWGHGADAETIGSWFDIDSGALIVDQRAFWTFLLLYLVMRGAGPLSVDAAISSALAPDGTDRSDDSTPLPSAHDSSSGARQPTEPKLTAGVTEDARAGAPPLPPARRTSVTGSQN